MTNYPEHQWQIAAFLLFWSICMYSFTLLRPEARRAVIRVGAKITLVGAIVFALRGALLSPDQRDWIQLLAYYAGVVPYTWAVGYISQVLAANQAKKWPLLEAACLKAKPVFGSLVIFTVFFCIAFPAPAISITHRFVSPFPWLDAAYNLAHLFFLGVSAIVFGREAFRRQHVASTLMRVQHTALLLGSVVFSLLSVNYLVATASTTMTLPGPAEWATRNLFLPAELLALILGGLAYMVGLFLYDSNEEMQRMHAHADLWIEYRANLELELYGRFGSLIGDRDTDVFFKLVADPHFHKDSFPFKLQLTRKERDNAAYMVKLLGLIAHGDAQATRMIAGLKTLHKRLAKDTANVSARVVRKDTTTTYDLSNDSLYAATAPALELTSKIPKTDLRNRPLWTQIAALVAAHAGFLPAQTAAHLLDPNSHSTSSPVQESYATAKDPELLNWVLPK